MNVAFLFALLITVQGSLLSTHDGAAPPKHMLARADASTDVPKERARPSVYRLRTGVLTRTHAVAPKTTAFIRACWHGCEHSDSNTFIRQRRYSEKRS